MTNAMARGVTPPVTPTIPNANEEATRQIVNFHEVQEVHRDKVEITEQDTMARGAPPCNNKQQLEQVKPSP